MYRLSSRVFLFISSILVAIAAMAVSVQAQMTAPGPATSPQVSPIGGQEKTAAQLNPDALVFEGAVDPKEYHMGPGDVLQCRLWTLNESLNLMVSPEQILVVPRVGEFSAEGKTLADLKTEVEKKASQVFPKSADAPVSLTLMQPRRIWVSVKGDVTTPGMYVVSASSRADIAINMANKQTIDPTQWMTAEELRSYLTQQQDVQKLKPYIGERTEQPASMRFISVIHDDGSTDRVDLLRYSTIHDPASAPLLREGDQIFVPYRNVLDGMIGIYGAVQAPGDYEFVKGDDLSSLLRYAVGPTMTADLRHVELTRMSADGNHFTTQVIDLAAILAKQAADVPLEKGDRVVVPGEQDRRQPAVVVVHGEVNHEGPYPIVSNQTKLSEVLRRAGGLTKNAFVNGIAVYRRGYEQRSSVGSPTEVAQITRLSNLSVYDTANFHRQMQNRQPAVVVDKRLFEGDSSADVTLSNGDEIYVPERPTSVYVSGFVNYAGFVPYVSNAPLSYYIKTAGGYAEGAVQKQTRVIKAGSKAWLKPENTEIEAGDEIYVPKEGDYPENYTIQTLGAISGIVLGVAYLAISIYDRTKKP